MSKILIVDDDEMQLRMLRLLFTQEGYDVLATADGPQGITIFKEQRPDLVLLDIGLPSVSGIEVLTKMREIDGAAKVIIITGYVSIESAVLAMRSGALDYVRKPVDVKELLKKIESALREPHDISHKE